MSTIPRLLVENPVSIELLQVIVEGVPVLEGLCIELLISLAVRPGHRLDIPCGLRTKLQCRIEVIWAHN